MRLSVRKNKGQAAMSEYVIVIFIAMGALVAMSTYVQRALQARIRGAEHYMIRQTSNAHGNLIYEYEPYYGNVLTSTARTQEDDTGLIDGGATGIFRKLTNQQVKANTFSEQAPPRKVE